VVAVSFYVSSFGELTGLQLNRSPKRLEMVPYVVGDVTTQPGEAGNPLRQTADPDASVGVDLKYALRPGLTLTATANPDFGQVEADPAVVNLSAFETFFSERRPFFVEGSGVFRFDLDCNDGNCSGLFYSRRIGRSPRGEANVPDGGFFDAPAQTTILGATKLTGRAGPFSIGVLNAVTGDEDAVIASGLTRTRQTVEPLTSHYVDEPQPGRRHPISRRTGVYGRYRLGLAIEEEIRDSGILGGQQHSRRCCRDCRVAAEQRSQFSAPRFRSP
jgi:hypothetical protein